MDSFLSSAQIFELSSGAWLFTPESPADSVHIVLRGALELRLPGLQLGRRLGVLGPGRLVDCVELMLGGPRRTECQPCERSVVLRISVAAFQEALGRDDRTAFAALCATTHELIDRPAAARFDGKHGHRAHPRGVVHLSLLGADRLSLRRAERPRSADKKQADRKRLTRDAVACLIARAWLSQRTLVH